MLRRGEQIAPLSREEQERASDQQILLVSIRLPARYQGLRSAFAWSLCNGLESGDGRIQPIGALKRKHPTWVLRRKRTYFV